MFGKWKKRSGATSAPAGKVSGMRLSIGRRLGLGFAMVVVPFLLGGAASYWFVDRARDNVESMLDRSQAARLTAEVMATVHAATANLGNFVLTNDDRARRAFDQDWIDLQKHLRALDARMASESPEAAAVLKDVKEAIGDLQRVQTRISSMNGGPSAVPA